MTAADTTCREARLYIGAAPRELPPSVLAHVEGCAACRRFLDESLALDGRLHTALEAPLNRFRETGRQVPASAVPRRRFAMAASVVLALIVAGGVWVLRPEPALATELVRHIVHEASSWEHDERLSAAQVLEVLDRAGVKIDPALPVVYASACPFRGAVVPHLVVRTEQGLVTVMVLTREDVPARTEFAESGMRGVLMPAERGSLAMVARDGAVSDSLAGRLAGAFSW